jgi:preprotein translocase subunit YajC
MKQCKTVRLALMSGVIAIATAQSVFAQDAAPATPIEQPSLLGALMQMLPMLAICYLIFYFMVIKPQETKNKKHATLVASLKRGDSVVTSSGIVGKVANVEKDHVMLEIAQNVKIKVLMSHVTRLESEQQAA